MPRVTITVPEKTPQPYRFQLDRGLVALGRGSENDIVIDCGSVSVKHAEMVRVEGGYELRDLGSTNGIKLDGERRDVIRLRSGLSVTLGDVAFDFLLTDEELDALAREKPADESAMEHQGERAYPELPPLADEVEPRDLDYAGKGPKTGGGGGCGFGMVILFIILAAAAFVAGLAVRYQKDTGASWLDAVKAKFQTAAPVVVPKAPAAAPKE